jgi:hypothetical protein
MNVALFDEPRQDFVCRSCGGAYEPRAVEFDELCTSCWRACERWFMVMGIEERHRLAVNRWLARRLMLDARRMQRTGVLGRCEAISRHTRGHLDYRNGQCVHFAVGKRDERLVCALHAQEHVKPSYVGTVDHSPYDTLRDMLADLARSDPLFSQCLAAASAAADLSAALNPQKQEGGQ